MNIVLSSHSNCDSGFFSRTVGLDIGGANLKAAAVGCPLPDFGEESGGMRPSLMTPWADSMPFPLWRQPDRLAQAIRDLVARCPTELSVGAAWGVTMTGELADCFPDKSTGVRAIVSAVIHAGGDRPIRFWSTDGHWLTADEAAANPIRVAASNWHGLTTCVSTLFSQNPPIDRPIDLATWSTGFLVDIGSTTTDLIPFGREGVRSRSRTDLDRLRAGQLVYTGVRRTPLAAVATEVPFRGDSVPVAAELFATTLDTGLLAGFIAEDAGDHDTADGRPATRGHALDRVARMLCCDRTELTADEVQSLAHYWIDQQRGQIVKALERQRASGLAWPDLVVVCGEGGWLARLVVADWFTRNRRDVPLAMVSLADLIPSACARAACAWSMAMLAAPLGAERGSNR